MSEKELNQYLAADVDEGGEIAVRRTGVPRCGMCFRDLDTQYGRLFHGPVRGDGSVRCRAPEAFDKAGGEVSTWAMIPAQEIALLRTEVERLRENDRFTLADLATAEQNARTALDRAERAEAEVREMALQELSFQTEAEENYRRWLRAEAKLARVEALPRHMVAAWLVGPKEGEERMTSVYVVRADDLEDALEGQ